MAGVHFLLAVTVVGGIWTVAICEIVRDVRRHG